MPYLKTSIEGTPHYFVLDATEKAFLVEYLHLNNVVLLERFNAHFGCTLARSHLHCLLWRNGLKRQNKGIPYSFFEKAFVKAHLEKMTDNEIGKYLGRTGRSIEKLRWTINAHRSEATRFRMKQALGKLGLDATRRKLQSGELIHAATRLTDGIVKGLIKRGTNLTNNDIPTALIEIQRARILNNRILAKLKNDISNGAR